MSRDEILLFVVTIFATITISATILIPPHAPHDLFVAVFLDAILWIAYFNYRIS